MAVSKRNQVITKSNFEFTPDARFAFAEISNWRNTGMNEFSEDKLIEQTAVNPIRNSASSNGARIFGELWGASAEASVGKDAVFV